MVARYRISRNWVALTLIVVGMSVAVTAYAVSKKRASESCTTDSECKGHCYKKQSGDKVCVDCSSSTINSARGRIERYCKSEPRTCTSIPATSEVSEAFFADRIKSGDECIDTRKDENEDCWDGGDEGHKQAVKEAEKARRNCYDEWNNRKSSGFLYTCSDSTYNSKSRDADGYCSAYGKGCQQWSKNEDVVDCDDIEDTLEKVDKCVNAVESLDSACLPRLNRSREKQWKQAQESLDYCKAVLSHKQSKKLCK